MSNSNFYLFDDIIAAGRAKMKSVRPARLPEMGKSSFAAEYCVVSIGLPRMSGHTSYIRAHAKPGDIVITMSAPSLNDYEDAFRGMRSGGVEVFSHAPPDDWFARRQTMPGITIEDVWVDTPAHALRGFTHRHFDNLAKMLSPNSMIIMMGEPIIYR